MKIKKEDFEIVGRKKWVLSPKKLAVSNEEWVQFKKQKMKEGVRKESIQRYERDRRRLLKLLKFLEEQRQKAGPKKVVEKPIEVEKAHNTHVFVFDCEVPMWSDWSQRKQHFISYKAVGNQPPSEQIAFRVHQRYYPEHRVLGFWYHNTIKVKEKGE